MGRDLSLLVADIVTFSDVDNWVDDNDKEHTREQDPEGDFVLVFTELATLFDSNEPTNTIM
jgi:hypothetical protein